MSNCAHVGVKDGDLSDIVAKVLCDFLLEREPDLGPEPVRLGRSPLCVEVIWWQVGRRADDAAAVVTEGKDWVVARGVSVYLRGSMRKPPPLPECAD
jgi:hypothetical protein